MLTSCHDYIHIVMGMVSFLHMIVAFAVLVQMNADESGETPGDVIQQMLLGFKSTTSNFVNVMPSTTKSKSISSGSVHYNPHPGFVTTGSPVDEIWP
jgi:hypothetical protein